MRQQDVFLLPDGRHGCGRGLQLVVKNNGKSRSWILRLSHGGRRYEFGLGAAKTLSLKAAQVKVGCRCSLLIPFPQIPDPR